MNIYTKYPRTFHLPWSPGATADDKTLKDCSIFEGKDVVITVKMDGENTTGYSNGYIHARSLDSQNHESRNWVKNYLTPKLFDLPKNWRICGENLYAKHSIHYSNLESYFCLFSIWDENNNCLSWNETWKWANLLDLVLVPHVSRHLWDEKLTKEFADSLDTDNIEGFVVRNSDSFNYKDFSKNVAKYVRAGHVADNTHWMQQKVIKNKLLENNP